MRVAVIGGTGLVGRHATKALQHAGHDAVVVARSTGIDVIAGTGLDAALAGIEAVIDVTNTAESDAEAAREFFAATTGQLLAAEQGRGGAASWTGRATRADHLRRLACRRSRVHIVRIDSSPIGSNRRPACSKD